MRVYISVVACTEKRNVQKSRIRMHAQISHELNVELEWQSKAKECVHSRQNYFLQCFYAKVKSQG